MSLKSKELFHELEHHLPFTALATLMGIILAFYLNLVLFNFTKLETTFDTLHIAHIFMSAIVSSAIFYRYKKKILPSLFVGVASSVIIGNVSDVFFPFLSGAIFGLKTSFHFPLIEMPLIIFSAGILGAIIGISTKFSKVPHFLHVLVSTFASLIYLLTFTPAINFGFLIIAFFTTIFTVIVPCCFSDIIFPFLFMGEKIKHCNC